MKIEQSAIRLDARHDYERRQASRLDSQISFRSSLQEAVPRLAPADNAGEPANDATLLTRTRLMLQQLVETMLEMLSGQKCRRPDIELAAAAGDVAIERPARVRVVEWQLVRSELLEEHEKTEVAAQGRVHTADGREIAFDLALTMARDYRQATETEESRRIELKDPLVINFGGQAAELSARRVSFDLDADGTPELVPELGAACGYLAFDADCDGRIKDGSELFGAAGEHAGQGFADLARHDADRNGWIDEADPAWSALGVWFPDGEIKPLKEAGVGAIGLASVASPFALKDGQNNTLGQIRRSGIYLGEDGSVGTVQQIDLAAEKPAAA